MGNLELNIVRGTGVRDSNIFEEKILHLINLTYEKIHVTPIINNQVRPVTLTIILWLYKGIKDESPVLLETLTLPVKHSIRLIMINYSHSVVLGIENIARAPTEVTAEGPESINHHCHMYGHMERSRNTGTTMNIKSLLC